MTRHQKQRHPKNLTRFAALDKIAADPRVEMIYEDGDGLWLDLSDGYNFEGCINIHVEQESGSHKDPITIVEARKLITDFKQVEKTEK